MLPLTAPSARAALAAYADLLPGRVPLDAAAGVPALWPHQVRGFRYCDVVLALMGKERDPQVDSFTLSASAPVRRLHLLVHSNPHPPGTRLARQWHKYKDGLPVAAFLELGGSPDVLVGDVRRGYVKVA